MYMISSLVTPCSDSMRYYYTIFSFSTWASWGKTAYVGSHQGPESAQNVAISSCADHWKKKLGGGLLVHFVKKETALSRFG